MYPSLILIPFVPVADRHVLWAGLRAVQEPATVQSIQWRLRELRQNARTLAKASDLSFGSLANPATPGVNLQLVSPKAARRLQGQWDVLIGNGLLNLPTFAQTFPAVAQLAELLHAHQHDYRSIPVIHLLDNMDTFVLVKAILSGTRPINPSGRATLTQLLDDATEPVS